MRAKLIALAAMVALVSIPLIRVRAVRAPYSHSAADIAAILPAQVGNYRIVEQWTRQPPNGWLWLTHLYNHERGAVYSRGDSYPSVRVDLLFGTLADHNPLGCRISMGATTQWSKLQTVPTAHADAILEVSLAQEAAQTELIASSECYATGCTETAIPSSGFVLPHLELQRFFEPTPPAVVPVAIVVTADQCDRRDCAALLQAELSNFLAAFDLDRIRLFAAAAR